MTIADLLNLPNSAALARSIGASRYFTGRPCANGHLCERRIKNSKCAECYRENFTKWRKGPGAEKFRASQDRWAEHNPEKCTAKVVKWQQANREKHVANVQRWQERNPEDRRAHDRTRRARQKGATGKHTATDIRAITLAQKGKCAWCRVDLRRVQRHADHILPLALGGSNDRQNIQILCRSCNLSKGAKHPIEFARREGRLL